MACFIAPLVEAVAVSVVKKQVEKREKNPQSSFSQKLGWLNKMLWGGSFLLLAEHIWHGEIVVTPPFLTAMSSTAGIQIMLKEIAVNGVSMAAVVTAAWGVMLLASKYLERQKIKKAVQE